MGASTVPAAGRWHGGMKKASSSLFYSWLIFGSMHSCFTFILFEEFPFQQAYTVKQSKYSVKCMEHTHSSMAAKR